MARVCAAQPRQPEIGGGSLHYAGHWTEWTSVTLPSDEGGQPALISKSSFKSNFSLKSQFWALKRIISINTLVIFVPFIPNALLSQGEE